MPLMLWLIGAIIKVIVRRHDGKSCTVVTPDGRVETIGMSGRQVRKIITDRP